ncbi:MAG: trypsin [Desulfobacterales bacterium]|nr:MAG: trypsin [Desulfobacterales bacterium]
MKKSLLLLCWLIAVLPASSGLAFEDSAQDRSLSPYFYIENKDSGVENFPLKSTAVQVDITGVIADVTVRQSYANMGGEVIHGKYIFPGSTRAAVHGMTMTIGEKVIHARVKEKEEARKTFAAAKKQGKNAALLEQQRPNVFSMNVANIMPGDTVIVELKYTELLVPTDGIYEFVYPAVVGPRYSSDAEGRDGRVENWVANPYLVEGSEPHTEFTISVNLSTGLKLWEVNCPTHDIIVAYQGESRATAKLKDPAQFGGDRDYVLQYRLAGKQISSGVILEKGEGENFFLLMAQPPDTVTPDILPPREYSFVIDVSGSMHGFPLDTAKKLVKDLLTGLRPTDVFNILFFAGDSRVMSPTPLPAVEENINQALQMLENADGGGGTELVSAMKRAMELPRKEGVSRTLVVVTDGYISAEKETFAQIQDNLDHTNVFAFGVGSSVNRYLIEGIAKSGQGEPFVVLHPGEAEAAVQKFQQYIKAPVLTDIELDIEGLEIYGIEPPKIPDLFARRPIIVFGKWKGNQQGTITITGKNGAGEYRKSFSFQEAAIEESSHALAYLWARSKIARLSDYNPRAMNPDRKDEITRLGLDYNLLTSYTSFVAVAEEIRNPGGEGQNIKQPLVLPQGVSNMAVGYTMNNVPEPELTVMVLLFLAVVVFCLVYQRRLVMKGRK